MVESDHGFGQPRAALFATSIMNNLRYGKEHASMDEIVAAATLSGAHNFIMKLPNGYDTQVLNLQAHGFYNTSRLMLVDVFSAN